MLSFSGSLKVFVAVEACDLRKGFNGLQGLVSERMGHVRQPAEHVAQVGVGINAVASAVFDEGVDDGAAFAGAGLADE